MIPQKSINILVVDDHIIVREGIMCILRAFPEFNIVGDASSGKIAIDLCEKLHPNVVLMDLKMPHMSGIEATHHICERFPHIQVLILTCFVDDELIQAALRAGAIGYLLKDASIYEIANGVRSVAQKQTVLAPQVMQHLIHIRNHANKADMYNLKSRELEVLRLMVAGLTNSEIAERIMLSKATVKYYVSCIFEKLGVSTRTEAVVRAMQHHLIRQENESA